MNHDGWYDRSYADDAHREDRGLAEPPPSPYENVSVDEPDRDAGWRLECGRCGFLLALCDCPVGLLEVPC